MLRLSPPALIALALGIPLVGQNPTESDFQTLFDKASLKYSPNEKKALIKAYRGRPLQELLDRLIADHEAYVAPIKAKFEAYLSESQAALDLPESPNKRRQVERVMVKWNPFSKKLHRDTQFSLAPLAITFFKGYRQGLTDDEVRSLNVKATIVMTDAHIEQQRREIAVGMPTLDYLNKQ